MFVNQMFQLNSCLLAKQSKKNFMLIQEDISSLVHQMCQCDFMLGESNIPWKFYHNLMIPIIEYIPWLILVK